MVADKVWVGQELKRMGLSRGFIEESLQYYEPESFKQTVTLNLLGFLTPPGQHMNHVTDKATNEASKFIKANQAAFDLAEKKYKVSQGVISSLLWIETRHGDDMGRFHIVSVYLHLLQADLKANRKALELLAVQKNNNQRSFNGRTIRTIIAERTKRKSDWAREQILALARIRKQQHLDIKTLRGSYAGAFGLPQFIPSSYRSFAKSFKVKATPNLRQAQDAIMSVANYLAKSGWDPHQEDAQVAALMKYNNSRDYADSILAIAKNLKIREKPADDQRVSSSEKEGDI